MSSDSAISVQHVSKVFSLGLSGRTNSFATIIRERSRHPFRGGTKREQFVALDDVSFDVDPGEVVGVIGRNGAGKSTLLKILSRITPPSAGTVELGGTVGSLLEVGTGFHPELTGIENVYLNGTILGMTTKQVDGRLDEIVAFAEVDQFLETPVKRYSSGMRVRLAFAVAAHLEPEILIIDEVLSVGDAAFQVKCLDKMKSIAATDGRTVLYVSHNLVTVENLCPRSLLLGAGRLVYDGPTQETLARYQQMLPHASSAGVSGVFDLRSADRGGSVDAGMFTRLTMRPGGVTASDTARMGDRLRLEIEVEGMDDVADAMFMVSFGSSSSQRLFRMTSRMVPLHAAQPRNARETVVMDIPSLPLLPGEYQVSVSLHRDPRLAGGDSIVDQVHRAAEFTVIAADVYGNGYRPGHLDGLVMVPFDWELRPSAAAEAPDPAQPSV